MSSATRRWPRHDQVERALALADAALAHEQHAQAEHVEQHAVDDLANREPVLEQCGDLADRAAVGTGVRRSGRFAVSASRTRSAGTSTAR